MILVLIYLMINNNVYLMFCSFLCNFVGNGNPAVLFHWLYYSFFFCNTNVREVLAEMNHSCRCGWLCRFFLMTPPTEGQKRWSGRFGNRCSFFLLFPSTRPTLGELDQRWLRFSDVLGRSPASGAVVGWTPLQRRARHSGDWPCLQRPWAEESLDREEVTPFPVCARFQTWASVTSVHSKL